MIRVTGRPRDSKIASVCSLSLMISVGARREGIFRAAVIALTREPARKSRRNARPRSARRRA